RHASGGATANDLRAPPSLAGDLREPHRGRVGAHVEALYHHDEGASVSRIAPRPRDGALLLSFAQERLWFLEQLAGSAATNNLPAALRLRGALDVEALRRAFEEVARRHEVLRTTYDSADGQPRAVVALPTGWSLPVDDLRTVA